MAAMRDEVVPGLAEAIEGRRSELGLSPGRFAEVAGVTAQGLMPLRKGYRRNYQLNLKRGVCAALRWVDGSIDYLMQGLDPVTFEEEIERAEDELAEYQRAYEEAPDPDTARDFARAQQRFARVVEQFGDGAPAAAKIEPTELEKIWAAIDMLARAQGVDLTLVRTTPSIKVTNDQFAAAAGTGGSPKSPRKRKTGFTNIGDDGPHADDA